MNLITELVTRGLMPTGKRCFSLRRLMLGIVLQDAHHMISRPIICLQVKECEYAICPKRQSGPSLHNSCLILPARYSVCWEFECDRRLNICWRTLFRTSAKTDAFAGNSPVKKPGGKGDGKLWLAHG